MYQMLPRSTKVVIVGGGVIGCSVAYHLTKFGWKDVVLLERDQLTSGTTWHAAGLVSQLGPSAAVTKIRKYTLDLYKKLEKEIDHSAGLRLNGALSIAQTDSRWQELKRQATTAQLYDVDIEILDKETIKKNYPMMHTEDLKGGLGSASLILENNFTVGALLAVSSVGSTMVPGGNHFWAAPFELNSEFGGLGPANKFDNIRISAKREPPFTGESTTIGIIATDAELTKAQATRISTAAHDGIARSIFPSHTPFDGDLIFCVSTGAKALTNPTIDTMNIGNAAAHCVARAIARAVYYATPEKSDKLPCWSDFSGTTSAN